MRGGALCWSPMASQESGSQVSVSHNNLGNGVKIQRSTPDPGGLCAGFPSDSSGPRHLLTDALQVSILSELVIYSIIFSGNVDLME